MSEVFVEVLLDQNLTKRLDYSVPIEWAAKLETGCRVEVPLRTGFAKGTIVAVKAHSIIPHVRSISRLLSTEAELSPSQWKLANWMSRYYAAPLQRVLKCFIPPSIRKNVSEKKQIHVSLAVTHKKAIQICEQLRVQGPEEASALETILQQKTGCFAMQLRSEFQIPQKILNRLVKKNILSLKKIAPHTDLLLEEEFFLSKPKLLNEEQQKCLDAIQDTIRASQFAAHLIQGVTGSGKTEVYLQAIQTTLEQKKE